MKGVRTVEIEALTTEQIEAARARRSRERCVSLACARAPRWCSTLQPRTRSPGRCLPG